MTQLPTSFDDATTRMPREGLGEAAAAADLQLDDIGYEVHYGLTRDYAEAIIQMALEPAIREYCPNDSGDRFKDMAAVEEWLSKQRLTFLLIHREVGGNVSLAGYGWIGTKETSHVPGGQATFSLRVGEGHQGKGLAALFAQVIVAGASVVFDIQDIWLETWASNGGAVHIYHKIGFEDVAQNDSERPTNESSDKIADTRIFMKLPNELLPKTSGDA